MSHLMNLTPFEVVLPFLMAAVLQVTMLLGATLLISFLLPRWSTASRHAVLLTGLGAALIAPAVLFCIEVTETKTIDLRDTAAEFGLHRFRLSEPPQIAVTSAAPTDDASPTPATNIASDNIPAMLATAQSDDSTGLVTGSANHSTSSALLASVAFLLGVWLIGFIARGIVFIRGNHAVRKLVHSSQPNKSVNVAEVFNEALGLLPAAVRPRLFESSTVTTPMVVGVLRPAIVLPQGIDRLLTSSQLRNVLLHEIAHVRRRDNLIGVFQRVASILWWPHPLVHFLNRRLSQSREEICDNYVLTHGAKHEYARTLLQLSTQQSGQCLLAPMVGLLHPRWRLEDRIAGLLDEGRRLVLRVGRLRAIAIFTAVTTATLFLAGAAVMPPTEKEAIELIQSRGGSINGLDGRPGSTERVMFAEHWSGTTEDMKQLKHIHGIKEIWFSEIKIEEIVLEDLPDLERIYFNVNFFDESVQRQVHVDSLPIKKVRLRNLPKIKSFDQRGGGNNLAQTQVATLELANMDGLTTLNVAGLQLADGVLLSVAGAPNLTEISACRPSSEESGGKTQITDAGLKSLQSLKGLTSLSLDGAQITNVGLQTIGTLEQLSGLGLAASAITDDGIEHLAALAQLRGLSICETAITDAGLKRIVQQHPKLQSIGIGGSAVTAVGLEALKGLPELNYVEVDSNQLTEQSCAVLTSLPLKFLVIDGASTRPGQISGMSNVRTLMVKGAQNLTVAPGSLGGLRDLYLRGVGASVTQSFFQNFAHLQVLESLEVGWGTTKSGAFDTGTPIHIDDELMLHVANLKLLKFLWFSAGQVNLGDEGIAAISRLTSLENVLLPTTQITDRGAASFAGLTNLQRLRVGGDGITNQALVHFKSLKKLRELSLANTKVNQAAVNQLKSDLPNAEIQAQRIEIDYR